MLATTVTVPSECCVLLVSVLRESFRAPNRHNTSAAGRAFEATHDAKVVS